MSADELRRHLNAVPFRPFTLQLADGREVPVHAWESAMVSPRGLSFNVFQLDDALVIVDVGQVDAVRFDPPPAPVPVDSVWYPPFTNA